MSQARSITAVCEFDLMTITASAGANGSISPSGAVAVAYGSNSTFAITPGGFYHVSDVLVDSVSVGASNTYTFLDVTNNHTIAASFAADMTAGTHPTPVEWLNYYYGVTNYDTVAEIDTDLDGMEAWKEYIAGTDPTDIFSVFKIIEYTRGLSNLVVWLGGNTNLPPFEIRRSTNLTVGGGGWTPVTNVIRSENGTNYWYDEAFIPTNVPRYYKIVATNAP